VKYLEILKRNRELESSLTGNAYQIAVLSNITPGPFKEIMELALRENSINAYLTIGDYDTLVHGSRQAAYANAAIIFWEACNLVPGLHDKIHLMSQEDLDALVGRVEAEIAMVLGNLAQVPLVLINSFTSVLFDATPLRGGALNALCRRLNTLLEGCLGPNQIMVDLTAVIAEVGLRQAADFRQFQSSMALYSVDFCKAYAQAVVPAFMAAVGRARKVVVLDCDNTLWAGVLGEDGETGIEMSDITVKGKVFHEVQTILRGLQRSGVLLALCSKNNSADVDRLLTSHAGMVLQEHHLVCKRVNWQDKATNLREIAQELSLGLESFIFVDDSEFELGLVRKELPQVMCINVPRNLSEYPGLMRGLRRHVFSLSTTPEDARKTEMYRQEAQRKQHAVRFDSMDEYLASLGLRLAISWNEQIPAARAAQLSQKTNQFNLTTRRYTEADIQRMLADPAYSLAVFSASDRHGDYGITGLVIICRERAATEVAEIDTFLMSCRVIARNVEFAFFDEVVRVLKKMGIQKLKAEYLATLKNVLVERLYDQLGFELLSTADGERKYQLDMGSFKPRSLNYIETNSARE
jgi:FkbH-like protein